MQQCTYEYAIGTGRKRGGKEEGGEVGGREELAKKGGGKGGEKPTAILQNLALKMATLQRSAPIDWQHTSTVYAN